MITLRGLSALSAQGARGDNVIGTKGKGEPKKMNGEGYVVHHAVSFNLKVVFEGEGACGLLYFCGDALP